APAAGLRRQHRTLQPEAARQAAHHAIDRAAFLRAAGEIDTTHPWRLRKTRAGEDLVQQVRQQRADRGELRRETEDGGTPRGIGLLLHALDQALVHAVAQQAELALEGGAQHAGLGLRQLALFRRQREAEDLRALL